MPYALFTEKNKLQLKINDGTDVQGNVITAIKTYNLVQEDLPQAALADVITFAKQVSVMCGKTVSAVYQSQTQRVEASVGGDK